MKILHVCKVYLPSKGGVQAVVDWLKNGLNEFGADSAIYTTYSEIDQISTDKYPDVKRFKSWIEILNMPISPGLVMALRNDVKRYDIVCIHYPFPLADVAIAISRLRTAKLVVYWHSEIVSQVKTSKLTSVFTEVVLKRASKIICSSPKLIEHSNLISKFKEKCVVIPFGIPNSLTPELLESCLPSKSTRLVFVGRHVPYKGIDVLIRAFKIICSNDKFDKYSLTLVGNGPLIHHHESLIKSLNLSKRIEILKNVENVELRQTLTKARCLVLPSRLPSEAFALVQLEAMALGRPVINTNLNSGVPWVARDGREAITVKPEDIDGLATAIAKLCMDDELVDRLGESAKLRHDDVFAYDKFCSDTYEVYQEICSKQ